MPLNVWMALKTAYSPLFSEAVMKRAAKNITSRQGATMADPKSKADIPHFIETYQLDMSEALKPLAEFQNMNDFFTRELKLEARPIADKENSMLLSSAADCRLMCFQTVDDATRVWVKGKEFSLQQLLGDEKLASKMSGGSMLIFRLAPQDYHRYHFPVSGKLVESRSVDGEYFTVNPIAVNHPRVNVFTKNRRMINVFEETPGGTMAFIAVGATCVGSIVQLDQYEKPSAEAPKSFTRGDCFGYFQFGGSTCILLMEKGRVTFDEDLIETSLTGMESYVQMGERIGLCHESTS